MQQKVAIGRRKSVQHALNIIAFEGVFVLSYNATKPMTIVMKNDSEDGKTSNGTTIHYRFWVIIDSFDTHFFVIQTLLYRLLKDLFMLLQLKNFAAVIKKLCYCDAKAMLLAPKSSAIAS